MPDQAEDQNACLLQCGIAKASAGIAGISRTSSITALWNLSVNIQLDIKGLRSQTSDLPLGAESNFAWAFCLLSIGIYFSNWCYIKC